MSAIIDGLVKAFEKNRDYAIRLTEDLSAEQMLQQPEGSRDLPVNHPAWVLSHLNAYLAVIQAVVDGREFDDPKDHRFGMNSRPESDSTIYASKQGLLADWTAQHDAIIKSLSACDNTLFERPILLPRWVSVMPNAGICLPYLMLNHQNIHLAHVRAWRRVLGMPSV